MINRCTKGDKKNSNGDCSTNALGTIQEKWMGFPICSMNINGQTWSNHGKMDGFS